MGDPLRTDACELFGVRHPIVQTGMGWVSTPGLVIGTANAGGLGILASATLSVAETDRAISEVRDATDAPFGVNLRGDAPDVRDRVQLLTRRDVRIASFARPPETALLRELKDAGATVVCSIGALRHAEKVVAAGADALIVQGAEGGGHTGSVATSVLLPQVTAAVDVPVLGAGGFHDGRGLVAALAYGASGIAMGTRFLLTRESPVPDAVKREYLRRGVADTVVTTSLDGVPQRVLRTDTVDRLDRANPVSRLVRSARHAVAFQRLSGERWTNIVREGLAMRRNHGLTWTQMVMAANTPMMLRATMVDGQVDVGTMASGQVAGVVDDLPTCAELIERIMVEAHDVLARLAATEESPAGTA